MCFLTHKDYKSKQRFNYMISVKSLEYQTAAQIRSGLRYALRNASASNIDASLHHAQDRLLEALYEPLYLQIQKIYSAGYISGSNLIHHHAPKGALLRTAAAPVPTEDPRIAKAAKDVIYDLQGILLTDRIKIQALMRAGYEEGASIPQLSKQLRMYYDNNRISTTRLARTITNDVYNRAHLDRYEDSGIVQGVQFSAHIDQRTSNVCQMLNGTVWGIGDTKIIMPPVHFNCRSRIVPWFGRIPGKRNFVAEFGKEYVANAKKVAKVFRSKYWPPMVQSKASYIYQRSYFTKSDIKRITAGINQIIKEERKVSPIPFTAPWDRLKKMLRYRKVDPDKDVITDAWGKSLMLDKLDERDITKAVKAMISYTESRIAKEAAKREKIIDKAWKTVLAIRKDIKRLREDIKYYQKHMKKDPEYAADYLLVIDKTRKRITTAQETEALLVQKWNKCVDMPPTYAMEKLVSEKEEYQQLLDGFKFKKR